jgi:hypothetical protein
MIEADPAASSRPRGSGYPVLGEARLLGKIFRTGYPQAIGDTVSGCRTIAMSGSSMSTIEASWPPSRSTGRLSSQASFTLPASLLSTLVALGLLRLDPHVPFERMRFAMSSNLASQSAPLQPKSAAPHAAHGRMSIRG